MFSNTWKVFKGYRQVAWHGILYKGLKDLWFWDTSSGVPESQPLWVSTDHYIDRKETVKDKTHPRNEWNKEPPA